MSVVFFTGAGISTESGIPDYRGPNGVWTRDPDAERLVTYDFYVSDPDIRRRSWAMRRANPAWSAEPNAAHLAIAAVQHATVITQNVDRLHQRAGTPEDRLLELHGDMLRAVCIGCGDLGATRDVLARIDAGDDDPHCLLCGDLLKTNTVMFGEALDAGVLDRAADAARNTDVLVVVGTSLTVQPAASLAGIAVRNGARLVIVNAEPTDYDAQADEIIRDPIGVAVPALCRREGWAA